jgi:hypothetical protein
VADASIRGHATAVNASPREGHHLPMLHLIGADVASWIDSPSSLQPESNSRSKQTGTRPGPI